MSRAARLIPIVLILCAAVAGAVFLRDRLSFEALAENRADLLAYRDTHFLLASLGFVAVYILIVALSLPGATIATLTGGFLFGLLAFSAFDDRRLEPQTLLD